MSSPQQSARAQGPPVGLCGSCRHRQQVPNTRGSVFWLCRLSRTDPDYPRYPRLPVLRCEGYEPQPRDQTASGQEGSAAEAG